MSGWPGSGEAPEPPGEKHRVTWRDMSLGGFKDSIVESTGMPSPNGYADWIARDFPEDLFLDGNFDEQPLSLTAEEERLFRNFGDGLGSFGYSFDSSTDPIDERQVVYAEAEAAGVFKGGIRRAAFSMGDLQAFQLPEQHHSPTSPKAQPQRQIQQGPGASKPPRLQSVPESKVLPPTSVLPSTSAVLMDDMLLSSRVSGLSMGSDGGLDGLSLDNLSNNLLGSNTSNPFDSSVPMPVFGASSSQPPAASLGPMSLPAVKSEPGLNLPITEHSSGLPGSASSSATLFDFNQHVSGGLDRKPPLAPSTSTAYTAPAASETNLSLQGYADELLKTAMPPLPQPGAKRDAADGKQEQQQQQQRERLMRRSQSAVELRAPMSQPCASMPSENPRRQFMVELTTPDGHTYTAGRLSQEERAQKILRYRQKRHERNFNKRIKYMCRKTLADSRPRVRGRFARNDDAAAVMPHETKKALAEKARKEKKAATASTSKKPAARKPDVGLLEEADLAADFPGLLSDNSAQGGSLLPGADEFDFPPVPMELYSSSCGGGFKPGSL